MTEEDVRNNFLANLKELILLNFEKVRRRMSRLNQQRLDDFLETDQTNQKM